MTALAAVVGDIGDYLVPVSSTRSASSTWSGSAALRVASSPEAGSLRTEELSRLGLLIRDRGVWEGRQLIAPGWIDAMHTEWRVAGESADYDRYALAGWGGPGPAWRLHGAYGQLLIFLDDAVVTITADDHFGADAIAAFAVEALTSTHEP